MAHRNTRRDFLRKTAAAGAVTPYFAWNRGAFAAEDKNDRHVIGCIGVGSMGTGDAHDIGRFGDIVAVCDVDANHSERAKHDGNIGKGKADAYKDYRKVLDRPEIDVVSIVTPDHWHTRIAIEALQAGKHVFCQKPLTLTVEENILIREACKKYDKQVFQVGTQQRSQTNLFLLAITMIREGRLGEIKRAVAAIGGAPTGGPFPIEDPPAHLDWDMWLGQAPKVPYRNRRCHYEFRWWYEYSGGKLTDWGAHHVDIAAWGMGQDGPGQGPVEIDGTDATHPVPFEKGYPTLDDQYNTATAFKINCKYANGMEMLIRHDTDNGVLFEGTKGRLFVNRGRITGAPVEELKDNPIPREALVKAYKGKEPHGDHKRNFFECIRDGGSPVSDVFTHVQALNTCHLAGIAARLGRVIKWDPRAEKIVGDDEAAAFLSREPRKGYELPTV